MKVAKLIETLQQALEEHGDLPIHYIANGAEYSPNAVALVREGVSAANPGAITGPHMFEPDRLIITGNLL